MTTGIKPFMTYSSLIQMIVSRANLLIAKFISSIELSCSIDLSYLTSVTLIETIQSLFTKNLVNITGIFLWESYYTYKIIELF